MTPVDAFRKQYSEVGPIDRMVCRLAGRRELCALFVALGFTKGAEIGVWEGAFSQVLCENVPGLHLTCVDPWQAYDDYKEKKNDQARLRVALCTTIDRLAPFDCEILRMTSSAAADLIPDASLDFVYIDGNHAEAFVLEDLALWSPKVRTGGIVAGHDYFPSEKWTWIQVKAAVDAFTRERRIAPVYVLTADKAPSYFWQVA